MPEPSTQNSAQSSNVRKLGNNPDAGETNFSHESNDLASTHDLFESKKALRDAGYDIEDHDNNPLGDDYFDESNKRSKRKKSKDANTEDDETSPDDDGAESDEEETESDDDDADDSDEDTESDDESDNDVRKLKVEVNGKEIDLPVDTEIPTKVDGKIRNVPIEDLQNAYASKSKIAADLKTIKESREQIASERRKASSELQKREATLAGKEYSLTKEAEAVKGLQIETILNEACFRAGVSPADFWDKADEILGLYYAGDGTEKNPGFYSLTEAQRAAIKSDRRVKLNDVGHKRQETERQHKEAITRFEAFKTNIMQSSGVTIDEAETAWADLDKQAQTGKLDKKTIEEIKAMTAEQKFQVACAQALANKTFNRVSGIISKQFPRLSKQAERVVKELEDTVGTSLLVKANDKQLAKLIKTWQGDSNTESEEDESRDDSDDDTESNRRSAKTKLGDKASPRHKKSKAATQSNRDESDPYGQDAANPQNVVFGAAFKTFA